MYCDRATGHLKADCFAYGGGKCGKYPTWYKGRRDIHLHPDNRIRSNQRPKEIHPRAMSTQSPRVNMSTDDSRSNTNITTRDSDIEISTALSSEGAFYACNVMFNEPEYTNLPIYCHASIFDTSVECSSECYHDSGANRHIFREKSAFLEYKPMGQVKVNGFGSALSSSAVGVGTVLLKASYNGIINHIQLSNVLHVPSARFNLLSQGCLERKGMFCRTEAGRIWLRKDGKEVIEGRLQDKNGLFRMNISTVYPVTKDDHYEPIAAAVDDVAKELDFFLLVLPFCCGEVGLLLPLDVVAEEDTDNIFLDSFTSFSQ